MFPFNSLLPKVLFIYIYIYIYIFKIKKNINILFYHTNNYFTKKKKYYKYSNLVKFPIESGMFPSNPLLLKSLYIYIY